MRRRARFPTSRRYLRSPSTEMDSRISRGRRVDSVAVSRRLSKHSQGGGIKPGSRTTIGALRSTGRRAARGSLLPPCLHPSRDLPTGGAGIQDLSSESPETNLRAKEPLPTVNPSSWTLSNRSCAVALCTDHTPRSGTGCVHK